MNQTRQPAPSSSKILKIFMALAALLLVAMVAIWFAFTSFLDADRLIPQVLAELGQHAGLELVVDDVRSIGLRGIELAGIKASGSASGACLNASAEGLRIRWQLGPLLKRRIVMDELLVLSPRIEGIASCTAAAEEPTLAVQGTNAADSNNLGADALAASSTPTEVSTTTTMSLELNHLRLEHGEATLRSLPDGPADLSITDFTVVFSEINLQSASGSFWQKASGTVQATAITSGNLVARQFEGTIAIDDGTMTLNPASLSIDQGTVGLETIVDLEGGFAYQLEVDAQLSLDSIVSPDRSTKSKSMGTGQMTLSGKAQGPDPAELIADGTINIPEGSLGQHPVTSALALILRTPELVDFRYAPTTGRFHIEDGTFAFTEPLVLRAMDSSELMGWSLEVSGQTGVDAAVMESLGVTVHVHMPRADVDIAEIPAELLSLLEDDEGNVIIPILLAGSLENPKVRVDMQKLRQTSSQGLKREAGRQIRQGLRRLLEKNGS